MGEALKRTPLQDLIDPFVRSAGGEIVSELISEPPGRPSTQADYFFRREQVIAELKTLEAPSFGESYLRKLGQLTNSWVERGLFLAYGTVRIDLRRLHPICQDEWVAVLAEPLRRNVIAKANRQIRQTRELLKTPKAKGLLWLASDGNLDLQPNDVWFLISRVLSKRTAEGEKQFSEIDGVVYFHPRVSAAMPGLPGDVYLWFGSSRDPDPDFQRFIDGLRDQWLGYFSRMTALKIVSVEGGPAPAAARFTESDRALPRVSLNGSKKSQ